MEDNNTTRYKDKRWKELSEESKELIRDYYQQWLNKVDNENIVKEYDKLFGGHNLVRKPINTWSDLVADRKYEHYTEIIRKISKALVFIYNDKAINKVTSFLKIIKIIEHGYSQTLPEKIINGKELRWVILENNSQYTKVITDSDNIYNTFLQFNSKNDIDRFLEQEENIELLNDYFAK